MWRKVFHALAAAAILAAYPVASLHPFHPLRWEGLSRAANGAEPLPQGGIRFPERGIARSSQPPDWVAAAIQSQRLEVRLRVRSFEPDQEGPARIFTLSANTSRGNLTLGQDGDDLILRLRTPLTDSVGTLADAAPVARVPGVFRTPAWVDLRVRIEPGRLRIEVGGETRVDAPLPPESLRTWNPSYRVALGNELTNNRPWRGEIRRAVVRAAGHGAVDYARPGALEVPPRLWFVADTYTLVPFTEGGSRDARTGDVILNLVGYVPLGLLLGLWSRGRGRAGAGRALALVGVVFGVSASLETLQFAVPIRYPSTTDLLLNTLGGAVGVLLALSMRPGAAAYARWRSSARSGALGAAAADRPGRAGAEGRTDALHARARLSRRLS